MSGHNEWVTIPGPNGDLKGYLALPEVTPAPGLVVIQEIFGVNDHIQDVTRRAAEAGYVALAPDLFWQVQPGFTSGYSPEELVHALSLMGQISMDKAVEDVGAAMALLAGRSDTKGDSSAVVGFCWGGLLTYLVSCRLQPAVASAYYGGRISKYMDEASGISNPILFHFGEKDAAIPLEQVEQVRQAMAGRPDAEVQVYPDAEHGFHCDMRGSYHQPSAQLAWLRTLEFFARHLG